MIKPSFQIAAFQGASLPSLEPLLSESEQSGLRSLRRLDADWRSGNNRFDQPGEIFLIAWYQENVLGVCGLNIDPYNNSCEIGRLRRLYVLQIARYQGVGQSLVEGVIDQAQLSRMQEVRVRLGNPDSAGFFLKLGFTPTAQTGTYTHYLTLYD